ncbi:unnamed protein product [Merluccius merluccius]
MIWLNAEVKSINRILAKVPGEFRCWRMKWSPRIVYRPFGSVAELQWVEAGVVMALRPPGARSARDACQQLCLPSVSAVAT